VSILDRRTLSKPRFVGRLVREAPRYDATVINGAARFDDLYQDLVAAAVLAHRRRPPALVIAETAWDLGSAPLSERLGHDGLGMSGMVKRAVARLDGEHVTYCVLSEEERDLFADAFSIPRERVACTPFGHMLWSRADGPTTDGGYVFAGGDSLRDYGTLIAALQGQEVPVRLATNRRFDHLPSNVRAGAVPYDDYVELLAGARLVVVPLRTVRRSAGLITYLNAMALGKPVIVSDTPAVREYVEHERTGLVVPPEDVDALRGAIEWALDDRNRQEVEAMGKRARASVRSPSSYWHSLRQVADEAARRWAP